MFTTFATTGSDGDCRRRDHERRHLGVDVQGGSVRPNGKPTGNVRALVEAAVKRLDDLHGGEMRQIEKLQQIRAEYQEKLSLTDEADVTAKRLAEAQAIIASDRTLCNAP
jgi:hypothetical protein